MDTNTTDNQTTTAAKGVGSDALLAILREWRDAAAKHREEQRRWESSGAFERARRQELMAEIYDMCAADIRANLPEEARAFIRRSLANIVHEPHRGSPSPTE